jgi:hypothetical protein
MNIDRIIIVGGGLSIKRGIFKNLRRQIETEYTISLNSSILDFTLTFACFVGVEFCHRMFPHLIRLPLVAGRYSPRIEDPRGKEEG